MVKLITSDEEWKEAKMQSATSGKPLVVDFYAEWCGPCKMIGPKFVELAEKFGDKLIFVKVDVDQAESAAQEGQVNAMPTFQVWIDGKVEETLVGANLDKLNQLIAKYAA